MGRVVANTPNLERASNGNFLWPPIADAVDTFLRRHHNRADPYERAWRLIHVWEAIEITLSVAAISSLCDRRDDAELLRRIREHFYGTYWQQTTGAFKSSQGAVDGSIDEWINILDEIAKAGTLKGTFLPVLKPFLDEGSVDLSALVTAWGRACDVPPDVRETRACKVRQAMRHVNSLRNRFAHVPFPPDSLEELAEALETITEQLFSIEPVPHSHEKGGRSSPLTGALKVQRSFLHGTHREIVEEDTGAELQLVFPVKRKGDGIENWASGPFVLLDSMLRPHVLTRVKEFDVCEYTRFRAEANAIFIRDSVGLDSLLPRPMQSEYQPKEEHEEIVIPVASSSQPREVTMTEAIEAIRLENYDTAISFFEDLTSKRPTYHIGWLRLGYAQREKAVRIKTDRSDEPVQLLHGAIKSLEKAAKHVDPEYQAQALYERSKALYHLFRLGKHDEPTLEPAVQDAQQACQLSGDPKYQSWLEYIERFSQGEKIAQGRSI